MSSKLDTKSDRKEIFFIQKTNIKAVVLLRILADGKHFLTCGDDNKIRWWRMKGMEEVGLPMKTGERINDIAVSRDGKWIVGGGDTGNVVVFDAQSRKRVTKWKGHENAVRAIDASPNGTKIVTVGEELDVKPRPEKKSLLGELFQPTFESEIRMWSLTAGQELLSVKQTVTGQVRTAKFSHDGRFFAIKFKSNANIFDMLGNTATLRIYRTKQLQEGYLVEFDILISAFAWGHNSSLFAASNDGHVYHLDALSGTTLSKWRVHPDRPPWCDTLASNGAYIAVSRGSSISFWNSITHEQICLPIEYAHEVKLVTISSNHDVLAKAGQEIVLRNIFEVLSCGYTNCLRKLEFSNGKIAGLENTVQQLRDETEALTFRLLSETLCHTSDSGKANVIVNWLTEFARNPSGNVSNREEQAQWELDFRRRCKNHLEKLGDTAMDSQRYHEADSHFSAILLLNLANHLEILVKRSKARLSMGSWEDALCDADEIVKLDPSSYRGHEQRYAALHAGGRYTEAFAEFHVMLAMLKESSDKPIRELRRQFTDVTPVIHQVIDKIVSDMPRVLIDTTTGRLCDKEQQKAAFKELPIYNELCSSMTNSVDRARIQKEVEEFYRYVMLSHRWEGGEPLFQTVQDISVHDLKPSSPNTKLQEFCKVAFDRGFHWAWSDTCCIDKTDIVVLHESLVAMFRWYRGSALTLVHLHGVRAHSQKAGDLGESEWNQRGWTYQEYVAAETVQFYTEDWKPYLGLSMSNHKTSSVVIKEMEQVSRVSAGEPGVLHPGPSRVRKKLFLASQRETTLPEDAAYSLLGIFNANIFIRYGEGKCTAVGRLLEDILARSHDITILAWTGPAGGYNSYLPADLTVYDQFVPPQIPHAIEHAKLDNAAHAIRSSLSDSDLALVVHLYHHLCKPSNSLPSINSGHLKLPGVIFPITQLVESDSEMNCRVYRVTTSSLEEVEVKTKTKLSEAEDLFLIHPWICVLLDQGFSRGRGTVGRLDDTARALHLLARLRQPFGALLLAQVDRVWYRRVATDSLIQTRIHEDTPVSVLMAGITTVDVK